jgi:hypothetical protein
MRIDTPRLRAERVRVDTPRMRVDPKAGAETPRVRFDTPRMRVDAKVRADRQGSPVQGSEF